MESKRNVRLSAVALMVVIAIILVGAFADGYLLTAIIGAAIAVIITGLMRGVKKRREGDLRFRREEDRRQQAEALKECILGIALGALVAEAKQNISANKLSSGEAADGVSRIRVKQVGDSIFAYMEDGRSSLALAVGGRGHYVLQFAVREKDGQIEIEVNTASYTVPSEYFNGSQYHLAIMEGVHHVHFFRLFPEPP